MHKCGSESASPPSLMGGASTCRGCRSGGCAKPSPPSMGSTSETRSALPPARNSICDGSTATTTVSTWGTPRLGRRLPLPVKARLPEQLQPRHARQDEDHESVRVVPCPAAQHRHTDTKPFGVQARLEHVADLPRRPHREVAQPGKMMHEMLRGLSSVHCVGRPGASFLLSACRKQPTVHASEEKPAEDCTAFHDPDANVEIIPMCLLHRVGEEFHREGEQQRARAEGHQTCSHSGRRQAEDAEERADVQGDRTDEPVQEGLPDQVVEDASPKFADVPNRLGRDVRQLRRHPLLVLTLNQHMIGPAHAKPARKILA